MSNKHRDKSQNPEDLIYYNLAYFNCNTTGANKQNQIVNTRLVFCALGKELEVASDFVSVTEVLVNLYIPAFQECLSMRVEEVRKVKSLSLKYHHLTMSGNPRKASESTPALKLCKYVIISK